MENELALVLGGGGARGAYQVGFLRHLARRYPELRVPIVTGVSAGAINAAHLANHPGSLAERVERLTELWRELSVDQVFRVDSASLFGHVMRWGAQLALLGGRRGVPQMRGLVDTAPLGRFLRRALQPEARASSGSLLTGIAQNLESDALRAVALTATDYATGQTVVWCQGRAIQDWERPMRRSVQTELRVDHVMASAALPLFFPAVSVDGGWFGDGGLRLHSPLAPATHLGARRIVAVSTRHAPAKGAATSATAGLTSYPAPAQVLGVLFNAVFLDLLDQDALHLERINRLLDAAPTRELRRIELLVLRPSRDLGVLAAEYEPRLPGLFRFLTRRLGTREASSADLLSMLMFQHDYLDSLIRLGESDADARADEIAELVTV